MSNLTDRINFQDALSRRQLLLRGAALAACTAVPFLAPRRAHAWDLFGLPSIGDQKKVGRQAAQQVLQQYKLVTDGRSNEVKAVGAKLWAALPEPDRSRWDYEFHLIDSKEINAFALPGGPTFFFSGLYAVLTTEDELAGVMGHEMTHVRLQHWAKAYRDEEQRDALLGIGLAVAHANDVMQDLASFGDQAISLKYSRTEEAQADHGGIQDMYAAGYNPQGMIDMFNILLKKTGNGATLGSDFMANHPLTTDRIKAAQAQIVGLGDPNDFPAQRPIGNAAAQVTPMEGPSAPPPTSPDQSPDAPPPLPQVFQRPNIPPSPAPTPTSPSKPAASSSTSGASAPRLPSGSPDDY